MTSRVSSPACSGRAPRTRGYTIPEYVIAVAVVMIVCLAVVSGYLYASRIYALASSKLSTNGELRGMLNNFVHDVRTAANVQIGTGDGAQFTRATFGQPYEGNAVQIYPRSNTNEFIRYYLDSRDQSLNVFESTSGNVFLVARSVTNAAPFRLEDPWGNVATNNLPAELVRVTLQFDPDVIRGQAGFDDYFQFDTRVFRRNSLGFQ